MAKTIYTTVMVNEAALTPTEHLKAVLEAADGLHEAATGLRCRQDALLRVCGHHEALWCSLCL
jgi:hypothetical protein